MADNYSEWMKNTLNLEIEDWRKEGDPELDNESCFHTSAPKIIYQVILLYRHLWYLQIRTVAVASVVKQGRCRQGLMECICCTHHARLKRGINPCWAHVYGTEKSVGKECMYAKKKSEQATP